MGIDVSSAFSQKNVLITGGLGFIGSSLAHRLMELGASVSIVDRLAPDSGGNWFNIESIKNRVDVHINDMNNAEVMSRVIRNKDYIFNLAGHVSHIGSMQDPGNDLELNCSNHVSLLELCRKQNFGVKIIYAGTRQIYGRPHYLPVDENHPLGPVDFNGISKMAGEWYHLLYHRIYGMRTTSLRMTNTYGPRMWVKDGNLTFIGLWFRQLIEGQELMIYGDGRQVRDFNYVDDVIDALLLSAANPSTDGQIYNLGGDEPISLLHLAEMMVEVNGAGQFRLIPFPAERKRIDIGDYFGDYNKIKNELGWQPKVSLKDGLAGTIAYYQENHKHYW